MPRPGNNHLSGMRVGHENCPDEDTKTTDQEGRLSYMSEKGGIVM